MPIPLNAPEILDKEFFEIRAKLLEVAASLDRLSRASGSIDTDPRLGQLRQAIGVLLDDDLQTVEQDPHRAEQLQLIFSLAYDEAWQENFGINSPT